MRLCGEDALVLLRVHVLDEGEARLAEGGDLLRTQEVLDNKETVAVKLQAGNQDGINIH